MPLDLAVNTPAYVRSSRGVRRYVNNVLDHLSWPTPVLDVAEPPAARLFRLWDLSRRGSRNSILWTPCLRGPIRAHHHVVTVHDCLNVEYVHTRGLRRQLFIELADRILNNAEAVVAISHATKAAILRNYTLAPERIAVIQSGYAAFGQTAAKPEKKEDGPPFILWVTNCLPHKNCERMCRAIAASRLKQLGIKVRVVGSIPRDCIEACESAGVTVEIDAWISDSVLAGLYAGCLFLLSPSLDEGHNLAVAEALQHGANVLCSDIDVHREFYQGLVRYFDPADVDAMVDGLDAALASGRDWDLARFSDGLRSFRDVATDYRALFAGTR